MIRAGVLILLFVVYQLWGTGIHTAQAQDDLARQFQEQLAQVTEGDGSATTSSTADTVAPSDTTPATIAPPSPAARGSLPVPEPGSPIGQIVIPRIGADFYMVEGV